MIILNSKHIRNIHHSLIAEMTGDVCKDDEKLQNELGGDLVVARTVIDYGQKDNNPVVSLGTGTLNIKN